MASTTTMMSAYSAFPWPESSRQRGGRRGANAAGGHLEAPEDIEPGTGADRDEVDGVGHGGTNAMVDARRRRGTEATGCPAGRRGHERQQRQSTRAEGQHHHHA